MHNRTKIRVAIAAVLITACAASDGDSPMSPLGSPAPASGALSVAENPNFNLEVVLRGDEGFGLVRFRQGNDDLQIVDLDVWVRDLAPNTDYRLQRAVDTAVDGVCTSAGWLTLGRGLVPQAITTDDSGTARESLFRDLSSVAPGTTFDIQFRVVDANSGAAVLTSGCYTFTVRQ